MLNRFIPFIEAYDEVVLEVLLHCLMQTEKLEQLFAFLYQDLAAVSDSLILENSYAFQLIN